MGLLPVMLQKMTNTWSITLVVAIIGLQTGLIECSGRVNLARPYLFRDFGMPSGGYAQLANFYQHKSPQRYSDSASTEDEEGGSSEEDAHYTPPLILDIDDPVVKARWLGLNSQMFDDYEEEYEEEEGLSSSEFRSRSSPELQSEPEPDKAERKSDDNSESGEKRGILDSGFSMVSNPLINFWKGSSQEVGSSPDMQSDEVYPYYYNGFDYTPYETEEYPQSDLKRPKPKPKPMAKKPMKPPQPPPPMKMKTPEGPKPMPMKMKKKPMKPGPMKMKPMKPMKMKPMKAMSMKSKPMKPMKPMMKGKPMKPTGQMEPEYSHQFHYQEIAKPDKLAMLKEKIAKFNPLRYIHIQKDNQPPPSMGMPPKMPPMKMSPSKMPPSKMPPPPMSMKKPPPKMPSKMPPKPPKPPKRQKMRPKPMGKPKPRKPPQKPQHDEPGQEFVMYFGEPFTGFSPQGYKNGPQQQEEQQDDEESDTSGSYLQDEDDTATLYEQEQDQDSNESGYQQEGDDGLAYQYQQEDETETDSPYLQTEEGGLAIQEQGGVAYQTEDDEEGEEALVEDDEEEDDDDESGEEDEEEEADATIQPQGEGEYETPQVYQQEETETLVDGYDDAIIQPDGVAVQEGVIEDDEAELAALSPSGTRTSMYSHNPKQKSYLDLHFSKYLRFGKKKRPRPKYVPYPYKIPRKRPGGWKHYKPKLSDAIGDSILKVVKNVGILPEYQKREKYGEHYKIKGKFTKTRPITLHHGLLTEVLRRK